MMFIHFGSPNGNQLYGRLINVSDERHPMSTAIAVMGQSGSGKSTGIRTLDPSTTIIINADKKALPWKGWKHQYNTESKNYAVISDKDKILQALQIINKDPSFAKVKTVVLDTLNSVMLDFYIEHIKQSGYQKWCDLADGILNIIDCLNTMRDDLVIFAMFHSEKTDDGFARIACNGRLLTKIVIESKFTTVLYARPQIKEGGITYGLETKFNNSTAKSPDGLFTSAFIPNDFKLISDAIREYEK
jgi:hypothetical protein